MVRQRRTAWLLSLLLFLAAFPGKAEEIWIKNQVFDGRVLKDGGQTWMELEPFGKALGVSAAVEGDRVTINGHLVRSLKQADLVFVSLEQVAGLVGAVLRENRHLGTVDVHLGLKPRGPGEVVEPTLEESAASTPSPGRLIKTAAYTLNLPATMQVSRDARTLKAFSEKMDPGSRIDGVFFHKNDLKFTMGAGALVWQSSDAHKQVKTEEQVLSYQATVAAQMFEGMGVVLRAYPQLVETEGQKFSLLEGNLSSPPFHYVQMLARTDVKARRDYFVFALSPAGDRAAAEAFTSVLTSLTTR